MTTRLSQRNTFAVPALMALAALMILPQLFRPLWYDEALTVLEFLSLPSYWSVYTSYTLPNNHILYTLLLRLWIDGTGWLGLNSIIHARLFSLVLGMLTAGYFLVVARRALGIWPALLGSVTLVLVLPFAVYGSAVRGYMLALLAGVGGLHAVLLLRRGELRRGAWLYAGAALIGVGANPTHLLYFFALSAGIVLGRVPARWPVRFGLAVLPLTSLFFYLGAGRQFLELQHVHEGYIPPWIFLLHLYGSMTVECLPLVVAAGIGVAATPVTLKRLAARYSYLGLMLPAVAVPGLVIAVLRPSPMPRFFLIFLPAWLFCLSAGLPRFLALCRQRRHWRSRPAATAGLVLIAAWAGLIGVQADRLSAWLSPAPMQDDLVWPYYMRNSFAPELVVEAITQQAGNNPLDTTRVFITSAADPPSVLFMSQVRGLPESLWCYDIPRRQVPADAFRGKRRFIVARNDADAELAKQRFGLRGPLKSAGNFGFQSLYAVE